jgi:O-antigen/teichoic acid export membrane protein
MSGEEFLSGVVVLQIVPIGIFFYGIFRLYSELLNVIKLRIIGPIWSLVASINIILNIVLIPKYGVMGAAIATVFSFGLGCCMCMILSWRHFANTICKSSFFKTLIASIVMIFTIFVIVILDGRGFNIWIVLQIIFPLILYCSSLYYLRFVGKNEIELFKGAIGLQSIMAIKN